jgi:hypothetical protein
MQGVVGATGPQGLVGPAGADGNTSILRNTRTADYTLVANDKGKTVEANLATPIVITVPSGVFVDGDVLEISRIGAGVLTIMPGAGVTIPNRLQIEGTQSRQVASQFSTASLRFRSSSEAILVGDIV